MKIRYTNHAVRQIDEALDTIAARSPRGEAAVRARILAMVTTLEDHPYAGQATSRPGVRRLFVRSYPYFVEYRIAGDAIIVMRIRHSARRPL